jgi:hypothetical protein
MRRDATLLLSPLGRDSSNTGRIRNRARLNRGLSVEFKGIEPARNRRDGLSPVPGWAAAGPLGTALGNKTSVTGNTLGGVRCLRQ